jgi:hypothetical protein
MIGTGRNGDYFRPKHTPAPPPVSRLNEPPLTNTADRLSPEERTRQERQQFEARKRAIGAFTYVLSDDKKMAIVEFVAVDEAAFADILRDPEVKAFRRKELTASAAKSAEAEGEIKRFKRDFNFSMLRTAGY